MKNKLEEQMSELMDAASLKDLMPDFDKEALWNEVATQLSKEAKKKVIPIWWISRAAAVLMIGVATWMVVHFSGSNSIEPVEIVHAKSAPTVPLHVEKQNDEPAIKQGLATTTATQNRTHATAKTVTINSTPKMQQTTIAQQETKDVANSTETPVLGTPAKQNTAVAVAKKKVTHYLDIDDELAENALPAVASSPSFIQMKLNKPGITEQQSQTKPFKEFVFALAR